MVMFLLFLSCLVWSCLKASVCKSETAPVDFLSPHSPLVTLQRKVCPCTLYVFSILGFCIIFKPSLLIQCNLQCSPSCYIKSVIFQINKKEEIHFFFFFFSLQCMGAKTFKSDAYVKKKILSEFLLTKNLDIHPWCIHQMY